jgi:hypothetical protein
MSRRRKRVCLQEGPHLNLNWLVRNGLIQKGARSAERVVRWTHPAHGDICVGFIQADMRNTERGWLHIRIEAFAQSVALITQPRHYGGNQWYFVCPSTGRAASVIWKPPGAEQFCSRHAWGDQTAYLSQFGNWIDRAHLGKAKMNAKLEGKNDPEDDKFPRRPKRMRVATYSQIAGRFYAYQRMLDAGLEALISEYGLDD